jgi:hypothetical protein
MKNHPVIGGAAVVGVMAGGVAAGPAYQWIFGVASVVLLALWVLGRRCSHRYATLQPPVHGAGPDRDHARWYCDRCGQTWDASFATDTRPRVIYDGFDEQKAVRAAARADAFEKQRRRLADKRAGRPETHTPRSAPLPRTVPFEVVAASRLGEPQLRDRKIR